MEIERRKRVVSFEDLEVFQRAYRMSLEIHRQSLAFPRIEQHVLNNMCWSIRCGAQASPSARMSPKAIVVKSDRKRNSNAFCNWRLVRAMRCEFGCVTHSISATLTKPSGDGGVMNIRRSRACCKAWPARSGEAAQRLSVVRRLSSVL